MTVEDRIICLCIQQVIIGGCENIILLLRESRFGFGDKAAGIFMPR